MKKILLSILTLTLIVGTATAQEICDNGIDDDGDGFIDCFDSDCSENSACDGFYLGNDASCEAEPSEFPVFSLSLGYQSQNDVVNNLSRIAIGDLDRDGIPEIVTQNKGGDRVYILNGDDASIKAQATLSNPEWRASIANIDDDNCGEVFAVSANGGYRIRAYDCNLNELWTSEQLPNDPLFISYADFDRDGQPEMYYKDEIRDPKTGVRLVQNAGVNWNDLAGGPVAVDILGDEDLELVINNKIYRVNLNSRTQDAGSLDLLATMPVPYQNKGGGYASGQSAATSVADYNLDGHLDVLISGANGGNVTTAFFWDVHNNTVKEFSDPYGGGNYQFGWRRGLGRINIGDLDGDGQLNAVFVSGKYLYALDENWDPLWQDEFGNPEPAVVNEETSGITGCTLFDFNGDGKTEVVYRDEDYLYIINGTDGSVGTSVHCRSRTSVEYPIVADVDADGSTEICVVCTSESYRPGTPGRSLGTNDPAEVRIYKSGGEPWVPARRLWNQHGYFNVNINDDLTVPQNQQKHHLIWSDGTCTDGPVRPLNGFLNQSPFLSSDGCPTYASPDLNIIESSFAINQPDCPETGFTVTFDYENIGDVALSGDVPITFYNGDPRVAGTTKLNTEIITLNRFDVGQVASAIDIPIVGDGSAFTLYAVLNDNGSSVPTPISLPNTNFLECDYGNNIVSAEVNPVPFSLSTEITDNFTCAAGSIPPNGSARVFRMVGGVEQTADYDFYWFNGTNVSDTADFEGPIYTGLAAGTYTVYATHKLAGCSSDTVRVEVSDTTRTIEGEISVDAPNSNCKNPNGRLTVEVNGGDPVGQYTYEWYVGNTVGGGLVISTSHTASGLTNGTYTVLVTDKATGCQTIESEEVPDTSAPPVVTASATDIVCSDANSGSITATIQGGDTGHTYAWYRGPSVKPTPDFTTGTVNNLPQGEYTIVVTRNSTKCTSPPITVTINQTSPPEITGVSSTNNTSCDNSQPNGTVSVTIAGNPADQTIEWFAGANTTSAVVGTGATVTGLGAGEYTVRLTVDSTGCFVTDKVSIINNVVKPTLSISADPVTSCSPFNGVVTATVDVDNESDYTFFWYSGSQVKTTPDFAETGNILDNLEPGFYTVQAFHNTRNCLADAKTIEVVDQAIIAITQTDAVISLPSDCQTSDGVLQVEVNSPNNTSGFTLEWYNGSIATGTPFFTESGVSISQVSNLTSGLYTVVATDLDNGCSNEKVFNLPYADSHALETTGVTNSTTCIPNNDGTVTVLLTPTTLSGFDESNYELRIYAGTDVSTAPLDTQTGVAGTSSYTFSNLPDGTYTIEALADATLGNCSIYSFAEIELDATDPVITEIDNQPNVNCSVGSATGSIEISIDGGAPATDYTITWYEGNDTSTTLGTTATAATTAGVNGEIVQNLIGGTYTVEIVNNATQCSNTATFGVIDNPTIVTIASADLLTSPITRCDINNSDATIANVSENGTPGNMADYSFEWFDENMNPLPNATSPNNTNTIAGLAEGTYFVRASNTVTGCSSSLNEFTIERDITDPSITLTFQNPERCAIPAIGELHVNAVGPGTYTYNWYNGNTASGTIAQTGPDYVNLSAGFYTVEITDNVSNCVYVETYELVTETNEVNLSTSTTPVTSCDTPDGTVFATVTSPGNYTYTWTDSNGSAIGTGKEITGLPEGDYTVVATDNNDNTCQSTATVTIVIDQIFPNLSVEEIAPLSVCDLSLANGTARASVDGGFVGYTFEWFEGTTASGDVVYTGPEFSRMTDGTYTVRATDNISQCFTDQTITITSDIPEVPSPTITVVAQDTHCEIDNGILTADVNGNTGNYIFNWYSGEEVLNSPNFTGERISNLSAGFYTVTATDLTTGCVSPPVVAEIIESLEFPEFNFEIEGVSCNESNGFASLKLTNDVEISRIEWSDASGSVIAVGPNLSEVPAGNYFVYVETAMGCSSEGEVTIPTEINPYNGISRNGDSRNNYFRIDCITNFPDNNVKIYNRAGTLVYEAKGYDNNSKMFDGVSNRGVNIMGTNVPDGTYFYVIDKNDGSKPTSGYLEIVN